MFREMRRKKQKLAEERECRAIIERANSGVMGVIGDEGYPLYGAGESVPDG